MAGSRLGVLMHEFSLPKATSTALAPAPREGRVSVTPARQHSRSLQKQGSGRGILVLVCGASHHE